jgi:hypothetical protein
MALDSPQIFENLIYTWQISQSKKIWYERMIFLKVLQSLFQPFSTMLHRAYASSSTGSSWGLSSNMRVTEVQNSLI